MEKVNDNEYPTRFDITHEGEKVIEVRQNGLKMKYAEKYGEWNSETKTLDIIGID